MNSQSFEQAKQYALQRLEHELDPHFIYHSLGHTRDYVVPAAERLADLEGVPAEARALLLTAAWYHDLGFIVQAADHEKISARFAAEVLPGFGYTLRQTKIVQNAISATTLPQSPKTILEEILTDSDLDVLGHPDFMPLNQVLRREQLFLGRVYTDFEWYSSQLKFMQNHAYFTRSARALRNSQKLINLAALEKALQDSDHLDH